MPWRSGIIPILVGVGLMAAGVYNITTAETSEIFRTGIALFGGAFLPILIGVWIGRKSEAWEARLEDKKEGQC